MSPPSASDLKSSSQYNHGISGHLIKAHNIRLEKYAPRENGSDENKKRNLGITGTTESRVRYTNKFNELEHGFKKITLTRSDFKNPYLNNALPFEGKSESNERFSMADLETGASLKTKLYINPQHDPSSATQGRPLATNYSSNKFETETVTHKLHGWPQREKRELFEWIKDQ
jgi:hypothetical protein